MILRRLFTLTALALAVSLGLSDRANANYDLSTSVAGVNDFGGSTPTFSSATSFTNTFLTGTSTISTPNGFTSFTDAGGSTVYLVNQLNVNIGGGSNSSENVYVATNSGATDASSWTVSLAITVFNPTGNTTGATSFGSGGVSETATFAMNTGSPGSFSPTAFALITPSTIISVGGTSFQITLAAAAGGQNNAGLHPGNIGATINSLSSVPEPASMVMLGSGLVGVIGLDLRRRRRSKARMFDSIRT